MWLKEHLQRRRNTVRFLVPHEGATNAFGDRGLLVLARAITLADDWKASNPEYRKLLTRYEHELRNVLKRRFDRFAVLETWSYAEPSKCVFRVVAHKAQGAQIPEVVDKYIREQLFIPEDFEQVVLAAAENTDTVAKLLQELQEPRPNGADCVPWVGETQVKDRIERLCARGMIAIDLRGSSYLQAHQGETEAAAWLRIKGKLGTGRHLEETRLLKPQPVPETGGINPPAGAAAGPHRADAPAGADAPGDRAGGGRVSVGAAGVDGGWGLSSWSSPRPPGLSRRGGSVMRPATALARTRCHAAHFDLVARRTGVPG